MNPSCDDKKVDFEESSNSECKLESPTLPSISHRVSTYRFPSLAFCDAFALEEREICLGMKMWKYSAKDSASFLVLGTAQPHDEETPCRGGIYLLGSQRNKTTTRNHSQLQGRHWLARFSDKGEKLDTSTVFTEKESACSLRPVQFHAMKGPVTAVTTCKERLVVTCGAKIMFYLYDKTVNRLINVGFHNAHTYVASLASFKEYFAVADLHHSLAICKYDALQRTSHILARDISGKDLTSCEFLYDGVHQKLLVAASDVNGTLGIYGYDPVARKSRNLLRLQNNFRVPGFVTRLQRINLPHESVSVKHAKTNDLLHGVSSNQSSIFCPSRSCALLYSTSTGALGIVWPLENSKERRSLLC